MAAGLGFKDFTTGEVLTAADVDGYLMQGVWVFASAAARDAAVTSPQEGNFAYLKDTNVTTYYTGSAWANLDTTGMTNPMTTTGDMIYSSSGSTPARLGLGTANQQLRVNSGATAPEWFTPTASASGLTLINYTTFTGSSGTNIDNILTDTYERYFVKVSVYGTSQNSTFSIRGRYSTTTHTGNDYKYAYNRVTTGGTTGSNTSTGTDAFYFPSAIQTTSTDVCVFDINFYRVSGSNKLYLSAGGYDYGNAAGWAGGAFLDNSQTWTGLNFFNTTGTMTGNAAIYGLAK